MIPKRLILIFIFICIAFFSKGNKLFNDSILPTQNLQDGAATIIGEILNYNAELNNSIRVAYINPLLNDTEMFDTSITNDGYFTLTIPILSNSSCLFISNYYKEYILLAQDDTCYITIDASHINRKTDVLKRDNIKTPYVYFDGKFSDINNDLYKLRFWSRYINIFKDNRSNFTPHEYKSLILSELYKRLNEIKTETWLTEDTRTLVRINLEQGAMVKLMDQKNIRRHTIIHKSNSIVADINYYSFLRQLNINSALSLYGRFYPYIIEECRHIEEKLRPIHYNGGNSELSRFALNNIEKQVEILSEVLGEERGMAFDLMKGLNFSYRIKQNLPLNAKELDWAREILNPTHFSILNKMNKEVVGKIDLIQSKSQATHNDIVSESKRRYIEIFSSPGNKPYCIVYWTWGCQFSVNAMSLLEKLKKNARLEGIDFIYITDSNYPKQLWINNTLPITGVHYRLNSEQINDFTSKFKINATPTFLLFNSRGEFVYKQVGYSDELQEELVKIKITKKGE